ncbi:nucleotidyltransferase domain-containing protein [Aquibacillus koreensis]|uniref:Nucleotidyltransferase domain-containing protein n=1 Tax=Aquibacillus koreensis TaxID=279446 RepID=A0A9X4AHH8_9BACI|nr:nucleotidyltransferase domain-containing protein [Aquibacillus koreensis]MCT2534665.1 nucleotidyltransferase domain-containing protein [Aquibacillus koreensis]MDC3419724.1 nucleotidyltransferase domain-containing protein [Aquibacillus koreensis]
MREEILNQLQRIIFNVFDHEDVRVYLFGSWAREEEKTSSDIDIALEPVKKLSPYKWIELVDRVEESTIPYHVELVNLEHASKELKQNVIREGILWKDSNKE